LRAARKGTNTPRARCIIAVATKDGRTTTTRTRIILTIDDAAGERRFPGVCTTGEGPYKLKPPTFHAVGWFP
jgi:hypothetical protein